MLHVSLTFTIPFVVCLFYCTFISLLRTSICFVIVIVLNDSHNLSLLQFGKHDGGSTARPTPRRFFRSDKYRRRFMHIIVVTYRETLDTAALRW